MKSMTFGDVEKATGGKLIKGNIEDEISSVAIDSRKCELGCLFFALPGENTDGHNFLQEASLANCKGAVVAREIPGFPMENCILVEDSLKALQDLAKYYLESFSIKKIAITGSTGKTTTKDMLATICETKFRTAKTKGNYNNHIGLPLTILSMEADTEIGIFEMGMDQLGEIQFLTNLVRPDIGIITNVGYSHLERLGSRENILKAKIEISTYFNKASILIINTDGDILSADRVKGHYKTIKTGIGDKNDYTIKNIKEKENHVSFDIVSDRDVQRIELPVPGKHNALNAALAIACGIELGITFEEAAQGLLKMELTEKRLGIFTKGDVKVIDDTYNASPDSMRGAIDVLRTQRGTRKIAILGNMFELGEETKKHHFEIGKYAGAAGVDVVVTVGDLAYNIGLGAKEYLSEIQVTSYPTLGAFLPDLQSLIQGGDVVLVKGSRGMNLEEIVNRILE